MHKKQNAEKMLKELFDAPEQKRETSKVLDGNQKTVQGKAVKEVLKTMFEDTYQKR